MMLQDVIDTALGKLQHIAKTETIFGEAMTVGEVTIIPVSKVSVGFAAGGAGKDAAKLGAGAGTGGGVNITPVALITITAGDVRIHSLGGVELDLDKLLQLAPEAAKKIAEFIKKVGGGKNKSAKDKDGDEKKKSNSDKIEDAQSDGEVYSV